MLSLMHAYVTSDFTVINVVENSHTDKPLLYKITGVWGNHEGSMLLWVFMLSLCAAAVALFSDNLPPALRARVLAVQGMIAVGFLLFILLTSNPFLRTFPPPPNGQGLNPVLQDPGLAFHPPFLYLGYVGFSVAFAFAVAALIEGRVDAAWARWVRPWTLASLVRADRRHRDGLLVGLLHAGLGRLVVLGSGRERLVHAVAGRHRADPFVHRGGEARHAEILDHPAGDHHLLPVAGRHLPGAVGRADLGACLRHRSARGTFILLLLVVAIGGSLTLYAIRAPALKGGGLFAPISREGALVLNNLLLSCGCATVFLGTLYPLFLDAVGGPKLSVGFPFFNRTFAPMMVPMVIAVGIGPMLAWKRGDLLGALQRLWVAYIATGLVVLVAFYVTYGGPVLAVLGLGLAAWLAAAVLTELAERIRLFRAPLGDSVRRAIHLPRATYGMTIAHLGLAVSVAGFAASAYAQEAIEILQARRQPVDRRLSPDAGACGPRARPELHRRRRHHPGHRGGEFVAVMHPRAALLPAAAADHRRDRDPHQSARRPLCRAGRFRHRRRLDGAGLLEAAGAVDLDRRRHHGVRRRGQPERPALARGRGARGRRRRGAQPVPAAGE